MTGTIVMPERRISTHIPQSAYDEFMRLAAEDGLTMSDRIATLVQLWQTNPTVRSMTEDAARSVSAERRRRRYDRSTRKT